MSYQCHYKSYQPTTLTKNFVCFVLERSYPTTLIVFQVITQTISSTLHWFGLCFGIRTWAGPNPRRWPWLVGTTIVSAAWLLAIMLLAANNFFGNDVLPPRIPMAMVLTLTFGYLLLLSTSFRGIIAAIPQHWLIGIQTFRVLGGVFIVRYLQGEMPGFFAIPAGVGDVLTGIFAPLVAYWLYSGKSYGRGAAIVWNLFGMADLVDAVAIGVTRFSADPKIMPSMKTMISGCVDPRVDPVDIFGLAPGEAAVIRNVGDRITPAMRN